MKLNRCFTQTFDPPLKQHGFKRKGILYYRVNGSVLQGIFLNACNPFQIGFFTIPYWCYRLLNPQCNHQINVLKKGYWAMGQFVIDGFYYKQEYQEECQLMMNLAMQLTCEQAIPFLDKIYSEDAWLKYMIERPVFPVIDNVVFCEYLQKEYHPRIGGAFHEPQYPFLWKAYQDRSFEKIGVWVEQLTKDYLDGQKAIYQNFHMPDEEIEEKLKKDKERYLFCQFNVLLSKIQENDLDWIKNVYDTEKAVMEKALKDELGIDIVSCLN